MDYSKIWLGVIYVLIGQIGTFLQLQASYKFGWYEKHPWLVILASLPLGWMYIKSVHLFIKGFGGEIFPSRIIGFSIGIIVFVSMSYLLFNESITLKNGICILLSFMIILIQIFFRLIGFDVGS
jgi:hypothetical protein